MSLIKIDIKSHTGIFCPECKTEMIHHKEWKHATDGLQMISNLKCDECESYYLDDTKGMEWCG